MAAAATAEATLTKATKAELILKKRALAAAAIQSIPPVQLPQLLRSRIADFIAGYSADDIKAANDHMIAKKELWEGEHELVGSPKQLRKLVTEYEFRKPRADPAALATELGPYKYDEIETAAYVATEMPSTYAALYRVLAEIKRRMPDFAPRKVLDFGSGPGTSLWALRELWPHSVNFAKLVESSNDMIRACEQLRKDVPEIPVSATVDCLPNVHRRATRSEGRNDLVIAAFSLGELPTMAHRMALVKYLWKLTSDMLVIIEPGTLYGSALTRRLRDRVLMNENKRVRAELNAPYMPSPHLFPKLGIHVVAPCAHDGACPYRKGGKCSFVQSVEDRSSTEFSYVVLRRGFRKGLLREGGDWMRVMNEGRKCEEGISVRVCKPLIAEEKSAYEKRYQLDAVITEVHIPHKDIVPYSVAKQLKGGDLWPQ